jgi:diguanylate cyclase (GGDEF)-like protein/PAS domain S-box-containing protein
VREAESERESKLNEDRLRSLFDQNPNGVGVLDPNGILIDVNAAALAIFGCERGRIVGRPFADFFHADDVPALWQAFRGTLEGRSRRVEARAIGDGRIADLECGGSPIVSEGAVIGVYVTLTDISARKSAERALQRQHERIRELYLCAAAANASSDEQTRRTLLLGCRMLNMEAATIYDLQTGDTVHAWSTGDDDDAALVPEFLGRAAAMSNDGLLLNEESALLGQAHTPITRFVGVPVDVEGARFGALCFATSRTTERRLEAADLDLVQLMALLVGAEIERGRARVHLRSLAYFDPLTNLPNRLLLKERLDAALAAGNAESGSMLAVLFLDLDRFKDVNDTLGHSVGDRLLQLAAERIVGCTRSSETVARMGGDEFIVFMPAIRAAREAVALADRLLRAVATPFSIDGHEQYTTTSIGLAIAPQDGDDSITLIKNADIAMYRAKDLGRNTFALFSPELVERAASGRAAP